MNNKILSLFMSIFMSFLTVDNICNTIGFGLGKLLIWARSKDNWGQLKAIIHKLHGWLDVVDQVIEDDNLSAEEELMIANSLMNSRAVAKIEDIIEK